MTCFVISKPKETKGNDGIPGKCHPHGLQTGPSLWRGNQEMLLAEARMGGFEPYKENTDKIVYMLKQ